MRWSKNACHKKDPMFQGSVNFIFILPWIRFSPHSRYEAGTANFYRFLPQNYLYTGSR